MITKGLFIIKSFHKQWNNLPLLIVPTWNFVSSTGLGCLMVHLYFEWNASLRTDYHHWLQIFPQLIFFVEAGNWSTRVLSIKDFWLNVFRPLTNWLLSCSFIKLGQSILIHQAGCLKDEFRVDRELEIQSFGNWLYRIFSLINKPHVESWMFSVFTACICFQLLMSLRVIIVDKQRIWARVSTAWSLAIRKSHFVIRRACKHCHYWNMPIHHDALIIICDT